MATTPPGTFKSKFDRPDTTVQIVTDSERNGAAEMRGLGGAMKIGGFTLLGAAAVALATGGGSVAAMAALGVIAVVGGAGFQAETTRTMVNGEVQPNNEESYMHRIKTFAANPIKF